MTEAALLHAIQLRLGTRPELRLFRNNVGRARDRLTGQHVQFGLVAGASDLIGILAPSGRLLALEVKSATGKVRPEQEAFLRMIRKMGGIGEVVRSVEEAERLVEWALSLPYTPLPGPVRPCQP